MIVQKKKTVARVVSNREIASGIYDMWLETKLAGGAAAGQFIGVYPADRSTLLPRPISICEADRERGRLRIVFRVAGKGTEEFSACREGDEVKILGILGNGYPLKEAAGKSVIAFGGGIGIPPLVELAKALREQGSDVTVVAGYRDHELFLKEDLEKHARVYIATEDGSAGIKGNVLTVMEEKNLQAELLMACGPMPMLRAVKGYSEKHGIRAFISLEERMACGVGACLGCVCRTSKTDPHSHVKNARICTDGPVFDAADVDL